MTDVARLEVLRHGLEAAAEEMGVVLARAAFSPNIRERRDHSCALFTPRGEPVAQAEHIPVHLGAMPFAVRAVLEDLGDLRPGDAAIVNDPFRGGTHLPDLTMVAPVHAGADVVGYVAARAHHADVGGIAPGSMPADATRLDEEGIVIPPTRVVSQGTWDAAWRARLVAMTRSPRERDGDLAAQHGALVVGARRLGALCERWGTRELDRGMEDLLAHTHALVRARLAGAPRGAFSARDALEDDGARGGPVPLAVRVTLDGERCAVDYAGTGPQVRGNLNAPLPVALAGVLYVLRVLLGPDIPSNAGWNRAIELRIPEGTLLNPRPGAAVAAGNVETSQRNVDLLFQALARAFPDRAPAQSQGTMNNVTLGGGHGAAAWTYYETLGGGEGATALRPGQAGIHTHMTNTRNTPIESLEHELPLRVRSLTLRRGTGGAGKHAGGDGLVRVIEALEDGIEVNVISSRRASAPQGAAGGGDGARGRNGVVRADGRTETLAGIAKVALMKGDRLIVGTPGGGGWGEPPREPRR